MTLCASITGFLMEGLTVMINRTTGWMRLKIRARVLGWD